MKNIYIYIYINYIYTNILNIDCIGLWKSNWSFGLSWSSSHLSWEKLRLAQVLQGPGSRMAAQARLSPRISVLKWLGLMTVSYDIPMRDSRSWYSWYIIFRFWSCIRVNLNLSRCLIHPNLKKHVKLDHFSQISGVNISWYKLHTSTILKISYN